MNFQQTDQPQGWGGLPAWKEMPQLLHVDVAVAVQVKHRKPGWRNLDRDNL